MADLAKATPMTLATRLRGIQSAKANLEAQEKEVRDALLGSLKKQGVTSVRLDDGTSFTRSFRASLKVKKGQEKKAEAWAAENYSLKVDTAKALKIFRLTQSNIPKFFEKSDTEYLTVRKPGQLSDNEE